MHSAILLAQASALGESPGAEFTRSRGVFSGDLGALTLIILALIAALFLGVKTWFSLRDRRRRDTDRPRRRRQASSPAPQSGSAGRRRSRRSSAARNPTLSETEGLPPPRPEGQAPRHLEP